MKIFGWDISIRKNRITRRNRLVPGFMPDSYLSDAFGLDTPNNFEAMVKAYRSWVYICSSRNAVNVASVTGRLYLAKKRNAGKCLVDTKSIDRIKKEYIFNSPVLSSLECVRKAIDIEEVTDHPFLDLLRNVNPYTNHFDLIETTELFLELVGNSYWYLLKNRFGTPQEIWLIPGQSMSIVPDKQKFIKGYVFRADFLSIAGLSSVDSIPFDPEEIVHFKFPNPNSVHYGVSPLSAVIAAYNTNENIATYANSVFKNMGMPEGVLWTEQELSDDEFERIKTEWRNVYGGAQNSGKTALLEKGLHYEAISFTPRELGFLVGRKATIQEIASAYGIPVSKITSEDVNLANAYVGERQYQRDTVLPRLRRLEEKINEKVIPLYDDNLFYAFENPVPEDRELKLREREVNLRTGFSYINELRGEDGRSPVEWGNKPILPSGTAPLYSASGLENTSGHTNEPKSYKRYRLVGGKI